MAISGTGAHVLVFPYPAQGHIIPLLDLTHQLAKRGLTITILVTPKNLPLLNPILSLHPSIKTLILPFPAHPSIPNGVENTKDLPPRNFPAMLSALGELYDPLLKWFQNHPSPPVAIISDKFLGWTQKLASQLGIRRLMFSPSGAKALSVIFTLWRDMPKLKKDSMEAITFHKIPNSPTYPCWQLSFSEFIKMGFLGDIESSGLVINSFSELERVYLDHLGSDRVWAVGPLLPSDDDSSRPSERGGLSSVLVNDVLSWLDTCEDQKVVYVCFGSQVGLTDDQIEALALGLEKSEVGFVWSLKYGMIPPGFEDRMAGRGLVIRGWAPQVSILSHRAVGSFLTHCGWNSMLEGLVAGVPMLTWARGADQFVNASLFVDELKVAVRACEGIRTVPNSNELAHVLAESVSRKNQAVRERAMELRTAAHDALKGSGSSVKSLDGLVKHLAGLKVPKGSGHAQ